MRPGRGGPLRLRRRAVDQGACPGLRGDGRLPRRARGRATGAGTELTAQLVWCPQPMRAALRDRYRAASTATRARLLEVRARRFYRIRDLTSLRCETFGRYLTCLASYNEERLSSPRGASVHLVSTYVPLEELPAFAGELRAHLCAIPADQPIVMDVESWRTSPWLDAGSMAAEIAGLLAQADFGRPLHRFDITVTNASVPGEPAKPRAPAHTALLLPAQKRDSPRIRCTATCTR